MVKIHTPAFSYAMDNFTSSQAFTSNGDKTTSKWINTHTHNPQNDKHIFNGKQIKTGKMLQTTIENNYR